MVNEFAICSKSAAGFPLSVVGPGRGGAPRLGGIVPLQLLFEFLQAPVEIARVDRPDEGVDHCGDPAHLARRDHAGGKRRGDRLHRRGDIRRALDRRQLELDRSFAADRQKAFDAEPQRHWVTRERRLDGLARQSFSLAREQLRGGEGRLVARAGPAADGITRSAFLERMPPYRLRRYCYNIIGHLKFPELLGSLRSHFKNGIMQFEYGGFMIVVSATLNQRAEQTGLVPKGAGAPSPRFPRLVRNNTVNASHRKRSTGSGPLKRPSRCQAPGPLATTVKLGRASTGLVLCTTLNAATGRLRPFSSRFPRSSSLAIASTAPAMRLLTRICPSLASAQSRAARLHTVPIAV